MGAVAAAMLGVGFACSGGFVLCGFVLCGFVLCGVRRGLAVFADAADFGACATCATLATLAGFADSAAFTGPADLADLAGFADSAVFFVFADDLAATRAAGAPVADAGFVGFAAFRRAGVEAAAVARADGGAAALGAGGAVRFADFAVIPACTGSVAPADFAVFASFIGFVVGFVVLADSAVFFVFSDITGVSAADDGALDAMDSVADATGTAVSAVLAVFAALRRFTETSETSAGTGAGARGAIVFADSVALMDARRVRRGVSSSSKTSCQPGTRLGRSSSSTPTKK